MGLFQCQKCGCVDNTALACRGFTGRYEKLFDWTGLEERRGMTLCSACSPTRYRDGKISQYGRWHNQFHRVFLPLGEWEMNNIGDLIHVSTGDTDYMSHAIRIEKVSS